MSFNSLAKSLTEAIEEKNDLRDTVERDGFPARTLRITERKHTRELAPAQEKMVQTLLDAGKTAEEVSKLLDYPIEQVAHIKHGVS